MLHNENPGAQTAWNEVTSYLTAPPAIGFWTADVIDTQTIVSSTFHSKMTTEGILTFF